ncbi:sensor histidine kinase YxjM [Dictyobacter vulcani]|uniref:Sensor histidine kinase YxjM n=1 Tax=Dictyobacter vulcani TaxID=2607529 RepID=A0A5J4KLL5_9CHLR|nr:sensor histidine kinase [Dictyobacter vulcani]GER90608.1 sensor histidine kinase YxjM [Dictyobacter vulcani]
MVQLDIEKDDAYFHRTFKRVMIGFVVLGFFYLAISNFVVLSTTPAYMRDWRGVTCIALTAITFLLYAIPTLVDRHSWPPPLYYALSMWIGMYLAVLLLTCIDRSFVWDFYLVFGLSFGLFSSRRLFLMVFLIVITIFAFEGLLSWPFSSMALFNMVTQSMTLFSITGFSVLFQNLVSERFERNRILQDLSNANARLEEAHSRLERSVEQEQELAILRERTRLAREMHDTLGHALVLIAVKLEAAQRLRERDPERCAQELESTKEIARESMAGLRASIADLRSPILEREHIHQALERSIRELKQRAGLQVSYSLQTDITCLPELLEETLWKVSQEALANIEKHAQARHVKLSICQQEKQLIMRIEDDGIGLSAAYYHYGEDGSLSCLSPAGHYGLRGMLERVENAGGRLTLRSAPNQGTTVELKLPLVEL